MKKLVMPNLGWESVFGRHNVGCYVVTLLLDASAGSEVGIENTLRDDRTSERLAAL